VFDLIVLGGGPAGVTAALRARELGADVALVERGHMGGTCTNDGCVPTRALAKAARLVRDADQFAGYGLAGARPVADFPRVLASVTAIVDRVQAKKDLPAHLGRAGVEVFAGAARFLDAHTVAVEDGRAELTGERVVVCVGGHARRPPLPGSEHALTHSDIWTLPALPRSMVVVGGAATGCQLASIFDALGARVTLVEARPRLLGAEDEAVGAAIAGAFRSRGIQVVTGIAGLERLERLPGGRLRLHAGGSGAAWDADAVVLAVGWPGNLDGLGLDAAGIRAEHGYVTVDDHLRTSAPNVWAAGDVTGRMMLVQSAEAEARVAVEHALGAGRPDGHDHAPLHRVVAHGGFTDPEHAGVGATEAQAQATEGGCAVATVPYADLDRAVIDGRTEGFAKLIISRASRRILGAHVVGEQAVEVVQIVAAAMTAGMPVEQLAGVELAYPTFTAIVGLAARQLARELGVLPMSPEWWAAGLLRDADWEH
jgi:pyruvate/2-oxoglutarate dehydrogenase complex dihydrolipoamide dehydrogenase (E3) component